MLGPFTFPLARCGVAGAENLEYQAPSACTKASQASRSIRCSCHRHRYSSCGGRTQFPCGLGPWRNSTQTGRRFLQRLGIPMACTRRCVQRGTPQHTAARIAMGAIYGRGETGNEWDALPPWDTLLLVYIGCEEPCFPLRQTTNTGAWQPCLRLGRRPLNPSAGGTNGFLFRKASAIMSDQDSSGNRGGDWRVDVEAGRLSSCRPGTELQADSGLGYIYNGPGGSLAVASFTQHASFRRTDSIGLLQPIPVLATGLLVRYAFPFISSLSSHNTRVLPSNRDISSRHTCFFWIRTHPRAYCSH